MIEFLKHTWKYRPLTLKSLPIVIIMLIAPFCYQYFDAEYIMARDEKIGFGIYFFLVVGALIGLTYLLIDGWKKR